MKIWDKIVALNKPSIVLIIAITCFVMVTMDGWRAWHKGQSNFSWDVANYYSYLPAYFSNNGSFEFEGAVKDYLPIYSGDSLHIPKTTYGMSLLYSPFYALGYKIAINQKDPLDGFSEGFSTTVHWGTIFYAILGLILLRNFLVKFYSEKTTAITLVVLFFGTILFYYSLAMPEMPHSNLFFLFSAFLLCNYHWHLKPTFGKSILLGLLVGLIAIIRPTEIMIVLLFIFWQKEGAFNIKERFMFFIGNTKFLLVMIFFAFLIWVPQMLFWHARTGQYLYFSYPGEQFFWTDPQVINVLFSYRKGLFLYTPLIVLAIIGIGFMPAKQKQLRNIIIVLFLLNLYLISCWWDWFFGGCFGARSFVQHFAYLSIPLAALVSFVFDSDRVFKAKPLIQLLMVIIIVFGISINLMQTYQFNNNMIHYNSMTKKTYWLVFGKFKLSQQDEQEWWQSVREPDYKKLKSGEDRDQ